MNELSTLVESCAYAVSMVRMQDFSKGIDGHKLFSTGTLLPNVIGVEITDSLDQYFKIGKIVLHDQTQLSETTPFTGSEVIGVRYKNKASDPNTGEKIVYFRIFDIQSVDNFNLINANPGSKFLIIHLVEFPAFEMFTNSVIYKTYTNNSASISDIVYDSLKGINYIEDYYNIAKPQKTKGTIDFWIPNWTLIKTLSYLQKYAVTTENEPFYVLTIRQDDMSTSVNAMKKQTIHYNSIFSLLKGKAFRQFSSQRSDQMLRDTTPGTESTTPQQFKSTESGKDKDYSPHDVILGRMQKSFDGSMLFYGMNGETIIGRDAIKGTSYYSTTFESFLQSYSGLGMWSVYQKDANKKSWGNQWASVKNTSYGPTSYDTNQIQSYFRNLYSKRIMLGSNRIVIYSYTNEFRNPGEKVNITLPSSDKSVGIDLMNSGDWVIWKITDKISSSGKAVSEIELVRDSYFLIDSQRINNFIPRINTLSSNSQIKGG
jgi:hypothetical protein